MEKKSMKGYAYLAPALIIIFIFTVYPLVKSVVMSFYDGYTLKDVLLGNDINYGIQNYKDLFADAIFLRSLKNTGIYVVFVVPCSIAISLLIATLLNSKIKCLGLFQTVYFLPYVTSVIAIGLVWKWIFNSNYGLLNYILGWFGIDAIEWLGGVSTTKYCLPALIIFAIWKSLAFDILIFLSGLQNISQDLYNAAKIDSTPRWRVFWKITVPEIMPLISYAFVMGMINAFKVYNEVFALFGTNQASARSAITVVYYIYDKFYNSQKYGIASAAAVVLFLIMLVLTMIQRRMGNKK